MTLALAFKNTTGDYSGTGAGLGGRLTSAQADNNNWLIKQAIETLQAATGKTISGCTATGNQLTITYTDATTDTITLPTATWTWRGEFAAVSYAVGDLISVAGVIYLVLIAHTGIVPFDAGRQIASANVYQLILDVKAVSVPVSEATETTFTPTLGDANSYIRCTNAGGCAITIPDDVEFAIGTEMHFRNATSGSGTLTLDAPTGVLLNIPDGYEASVSTKHGTVGLKQIDDAEWDVFGLLDLSSA